MGFKFYGFSVFFYNPIGLLGLAAAWGYVCPVGLVCYRSVLLVLSTAQG